MKATIFVCAIALKFVHRCCSCRIPALGAWQWSAYSVQNWVRLVVQTHRGTSCVFASKVSAVEAPIKPETQPSENGKVSTSPAGIPEQQLPSGKPHDDPEYLPPGEANMSVEAAPGTATITRDIVFVTSEVRSSSYLCRLVEIEWHHNPVRLHVVGVDVL